MIVDNDHGFAHARRFTGGLANRANPGRAPEAVMPARRGLQPVVVEVRACPNSRKPGVEPFAGGLKVRVAARPEGGKANAEVVELVAKHFGVPAARVRVLRGASSRRKVVEIIR